MKTMGINVAYSMTWKEIMKMMTKVYYHRNEIPKMENELWNLTVKDNEVVNYTQRFKELALLCPIKARGHTKRYCPGTENQNGDEDAHQNLDIVTGTFLLKNRYVPVLTSTSANGSFVFTTNSQLSDVTSTFPVT
ncbi:reverse transcriptase domain-containing protein [Tanacetum coccineum]